MVMIKDKISEIIEGDVDDSAEIKEKFSHDASMFELVPELVISPKNSADVRKIVKFVTDNKADNPDLSITIRSGGTCMSGGSIGQSLVLDFAKYLNTIGDISRERGNAQPGTYYRDFEKATLEHGVLMPSYPASRELCTMGGMVANNAGGERSLQLGKTEEYVESLKVVFADGNEYDVRALTKAELDKKMAQGDFEGDLYKKIFELVEKNYDAIKAAKPGVSKDSTGYHIWNVWDRETGVFDLNRLIVGSQGTLGIVTDITFRLSPAPKNSGTLVVFLRSIDNLGDIINKVLTHKPATFEGFDNYTLMLSFKLFFFFYKRLGWFGMIKLGLQLFPELFKLARGIPKYILLIEFQADTPEEVANKVHQMRLDLAEYNTRLCSKRMKPRPRLVNSGLCAARASTCFVQKYATSIQRLLWTILLFRRVYYRSFCQRLGR
jgi:FAD/FMN-containing dehydrogenase